MPRPYRHPSRKPKFKNRSLIIKARIIHPEWTLQVIADIVHIRRWNVLKVLKRADMPTRSAHKEKNVICPICGAHPPYRRKICKACKPSYYRISVECAYCRTTGSIPRSAERIRRGRGSKKWFCTRICYTKFKEGEYLQKRLKRGLQNV